MDENQNYFNSINNASPAQPPQQEKGYGKGLFFVGLVSGIAVSLLIVAIGYLGIGLQHSMERSQNNSGKIELDDDSALDANTIKKLQALEKTIDNYFFLHDVTDEELRNGMFKGLLAALDDPYSEYYTAEELNSMMEQSEGIYYGIGAYVQLDESTGLPKISGVIAGSPAEAANLRADDLIYEVDGTSTYGLNLTEAVSLIKGPEGTEVELTLIREG